MIQENIASVLLNLSSYIINLYLDFFTKLFFGRYGKYIYLNILKIRICIDKKLLF